MKMHGGSRLQIDRTHELRRRQTEVRGRQLVALGARGASGARVTAGMVDGARRMMATDSRRGGVYLIDLVLGAGCGSPDDPSPLDST